MAHASITPELLIILELKCLGVPLDQGWQLSPTGPIWSRSLVYMLSVAASTLKRQDREHMACKYLLSGPFQKFADPYVRL